MSVIPKPLADVNGPGAVGQVLPPGYLFLPQWREPMELATAFGTVVTRAQTLAEERKGLAPRPLRIGEFTVQGMKQLDTWRVEMLAQRLAQADSLVPLPSDVTKLLAAGAGPVLSCDTQFRRLFDGARVIIAEPTRAARFDEFEVATIAGTTATTLTLTAALSRSYAAGSRIYPAIETTISAEVEVDIFNDRLVGSRLRWAEAAGVSQLPGLQAVGTTPAEFSELGGLPILDIPPDWNRIAAASQRIARAGRTGRTSVIQTWGARALFARSMTWQFATRAAAWPLLKFFDSRAGRLHPFLMPSWLEDFVGLALGGDTVDVVANGPDFDYTHVTHLAVLERNGAVHVRIIDQVDRLSGNIDRMTLATPLPSGLTLTDVRRLSAAQQVRFAKDELTERWITDQAVSVTAPVVEVVNEKSVAILDTSQPPVAGAPDGVPDLSGWYDASIGCLSTDTSTGGNPNGQCETIQDYDPVAVRGSGTSGADAPAYRKRVAFWNDQSGNGRDLRKNSLGSLSNRLLFRFLFNDPWSTKLLTVMPHMYATSNDQLDQGDPAQWHDNTNGLTVFVVGGNREFQGLYETRDSPLFNSSGRFELTTGHWKLIGSSTVTLGFTPTDDWAIFLGIWTPGVSAKVWKNGILLDSTTTSVPASLGGASDFIVCAQFARMAAAVLYARALTVNELNTVGLYLSERYNIPWTTIV